MGATSGRTDARYKRCADTLTVAMSGLGAVPRKWLQAVTAMSMAAAANVILSAEPSGFGDA